MNAILIFISVVEYSTLVILILLSVWSISIIVDRRRTLQKMSNQSLQIKMKELIQAGQWAELKAAVGKPEDLAQGALHAAIQTPFKNKSAIESSVRSFLTEQRAGFEKGLPVLATLGSNAPFIGLFGTVLGIIQAFAVLGIQAGETASIMTGISRALLATAAGLFVAIPAVIAFNYFQTRIRKAVAESEALKEFYLSRLEGLEH
jgi:biopolymer transport protein ExbB/TolQ